LWLIDAFTVLPSSSPHTMLRNSPNGKEMEKKISNMVTIPDGR
jgi:hypothetical protein